MICDWILFLSLPQEKKEGMSGKGGKPNLYNFFNFIYSKLVKKLEVPLPPEVNKGKKMVTIYYTL